MLVVVPEEEIPSRFHPKFLKELQEKAAEERSAADEEFLKGYARWQRGPVWLTLRDVSFSLLGVLLTSILWWVLG